MAKSNTNFKTFVDDYIKELEKSNRSSSFTEYVLGKGEHYDVEAEKQSEALLVNSAFAGSATGRNASGLTTSGLGSSGYGEYVAAKALEDKRTGLADIEEKRKKSESERRRGYLDYLEKYQSKQDSLRRSVTSTLSSQRVIDPTRVYEYAVEAGLDDRNATEAVSAVYNAVRNKVKVELLNKIVDQYYTPDMAASYARSIGLNEEDVKEIRDATEQLQLDYARHSSDYLKYLESLGNQLFGG